VGVIGDTLSEARTRRRVDLEQIEAATGVRTRYLRAIEAEDWAALPEEFYARSFIRKYAVFVGVAPEPLVAEYRRQHGTAGRGAAPTSPFAKTTSRRAEALRRRRRRQGIYAWAATAAAAAIVVLAIVLLAAGGDDGGGPSGTSSAPAKVAGAGAGGSGEKHGAHQAPPRTSRRHFKKSRTVELKVEPTAEVWACVENAAGRPLIDGAILAAGKPVGPFRSRSFTVAFGNGSVALWVDGQRARIPSSPNPIGLTIDRAAKLHQLPEGKRPTC
jgi:cytoskeleton protein RodZ